MSDLFSEVWMDPKDIPITHLLYAVLYTEGEVDMQALQEECYKQRWVPVMGLVPKGGGKPTMICFQDAEIGADFIAREVPKGWVAALVRLEPEDVENARKKGWNVEVVTYRRKRVMNHPQYDVVSLVYEFTK